MYSYQLSSGVLVDLFLDCGESQACCVFLFNFFLSSLNVKLIPPCSRSILNADKKVYFPKCQTISLNTCAFVVVFVFNLDLFVEILSIVKLKVIVYFFCLSEFA